jgi:hypothetical protein
MNILALLWTPAGLGLMAWVLSMVRHNRLYVGYGVMFLMSIAGTIVIAWMPGILKPVVWLLDLASPAAAGAALALLFVLVLLIYILSQVTLISNRVVELTEAIAIREATRGGERRAEEPGGPSSVSPDAPESR